MQTYQLLAVSWYVLRNSRFGARVAAQAGSVFCENLLAAFAFTPWLRLGYSAPLRCACGAPRVLRTTYGAGFAGRATSFWLRRNEFRPDRWASPNHCCRSGRGPLEAQLP